MTLNENHIWKQFFKYCLVGGVINFLGYSIYFGLTFIGCTPKLTMTGLYFVGATIGFFANRRITFRHNGAYAKAGIRYFIAQFIGYVLNFLLLLILVDWFGFRHLIVQAVAIVLVAFFLFVASRFYVFPTVHPVRKNERGLKFHLD